MRLFKQYTVIVTAVVALCFASLSVGAQSTTITLAAQDDPVNQSKYELLVDAFEAENPDIKVDLQFLAGDAMGMIERVLIMTAANVVPDVFWIHSYTVAEAVEGGLVHPLDDFVARDPLSPINDFYPASLNDYRYDGHLWGVPRGITTVALYYNANTFDERGVPYPDETWTWDSLISNAKKLTYSSGDREFYGLLAPTNHGPDLTIVWQNEGEMLSADRTEPRFSSEETVEAYEWLAGLMHEHGVAPAPGDVPMWDWRLFDAGEAALMYQIPSLTGLLDEDLPWDLAPLPTGNQRATRTASSGHAIHANTQDPEAAWKLLSFLSSEKAQELFANELEVPPMQSVAYDRYFLREGKNYHVFLDGFEYAHAEPVTPGYFELLGIKDAALGQLWRGEQPAKQVMTTLDENLRSFLSR